MRRLRTIFGLALVLIMLGLQAGALIAEERYSTLTGIVRGVHLRGLKKWLEVENEKDKVNVNFRIGKNTIYKPYRNPNAGDRVRVEYLTHKGVPVAYTVTTLGVPSGESSK